MGLSVSEKEANKIPQEGGFLFCAFRLPAWHWPRGLWAKPWLTEEQGHPEGEGGRCLEFVTLTSRPLGDSPGCLAGFGKLYSYEAAWLAWGSYLLPLCHILFLRQIPLLTRTAEQEEQL